tara:strand:- start:165 stop:659 length:495 start_codon:yes stop_codon:yes gene_type:complete
MKLTTQILKKLIKEELESVLYEENKSDDLKIEILGDVMFESPRLAKQKQALERLNHFHDKPPSKDREREMRLNIQKLANVTQKGFDLKDPRITAEILNMYREIMTDPKKHYGILYDQISGTAQADQIHKKAKELFGDDAGSGGGKKRSFFQKTGSFLTGKGFKE